MDGFDFNELGNVESIPLNPLNENIVFAQIILQDRKHLEAARLELFAETLQRVGMNGRMPRCYVEEFGGYCRVKIYSKYRDEAWRLIELINKNENGGTLPPYIKN